MGDLLSFIFLLGLAFYWLMYESKWLTIRLERTLLRGEIGIGGLLQIAIGMVFLVAGRIKNPLNIWRSRTYTEEDHEKDMARLWGFYGRKQPQIPQII